MSLRRSRRDRVRDPEPRRTRSLDPGDRTPRAAPERPGRRGVQLRTGLLARRPRARRRSRMTSARRATDSGSQKAARAAAEAGGRQARALAPGRRGREARSGGPGGRRHDAFPLRELLRPGLLPLLHHLQVQRPVSAGRPRGGGKGVPRVEPTPQRPLSQVGVQRLLEVRPGRGHLPVRAAVQGEGASGAALGLGGPASLPPPGPPRWGHSRTPTGCSRMPGEAGLGKAGTREEVPEQLLYSTFSKTENIRLHGQEGYGY